MINLDELLYSAYTLGLETEQGSTALNQAQLRAVLLRNVPMFGKSEPIEMKTEKAEKIEKAVAEKKPRKQSSAAGKPRAVPEDETRCHARSFYEKDHIESGLLKVVRDDEANQFGDRCKFKKADGTEFCKHHSEKQPHGVWDGEYDGKFKQYIGKTAETVAQKPKKAAKPTAATVVVLEAEDAEAEEKTVVVESTPVKKMGKKTAAPSAPIASKKKVAPKDEEEDDLDEQDDDEYMEGDVLEKSGVEYDWIEIEDEQFMIDSKGNVYDPENEKKIGTYDKKQKKWLSGGVPSLDDE
jgi:hypothetical protein